MFETIYGRFWGFQHFSTPLITPPLGGGRSVYVKIIKNHQNSSKMDKIEKFGGQKVEFSPCSRPRMVFWIAASWSGANLESRTTPNSKMWFSIFWDTPTPLGLDEISWFSSNFASKTRISDLKSQILSEKNIFSSHNDQKWSQVSKMSKKLKIGPKLRLLERI